MNLPRTSVDRVAPARRRGIFCGLVLLWAVAATLARSPVCRAADDEYQPLGKPAEGWALREVARLPGAPSRVASDGRGEVLFVLCSQGDVYRLDLKKPRDAAGRVEPEMILAGAEYLHPPAELMTVGLTLDPQDRFYIVANEKDANQSPVINNVTIFRTGPVASLRLGEHLHPKAWLKASYPWGIGTFNHGVGHIAFGPDGFLYVNSGSRTDSGEEGINDHYSKDGEHPLTSCVWRLDPSAESLDACKIEIFARGLRNTYGFCWDAKGRMFGTENGPNMDPPEELNLIEKGHHYGFPYKWSNWEKSPYPYAPKPLEPPGLTYTPPIANLGPDGGFEDRPAGQKALYTFTPHSSPSGIVCLGDDFPPQYRGSYILARFGNLLPIPKDCGNDVLLLRMREGPGGIEGTEVHTLLSPVVRPVDVHHSGAGRIYICEFSRVVDYRIPEFGKTGRVLELSVREPGK